MMEKQIYFDHAATSWPKPPQVLAAMRTAVTEKGGNPGRSGHVLSLRASRAIYECREEVCRLFSFEHPERVIFTSNTTYALNMAIKGLVGKGDHVLISNLEHNSVLRPLHRLSAHEEKGITYSMFDASDAADEETVFCFRRALRPNTRVAVVSAASNVCGRILPISKIAELCHARNIRLIVDGAQAGGVLPLDFSRLGADVLCLAGHKGLYGPQGTGIMICAPDVEPESFAEGGNGVNSEEREMGDVLPERLEAGTLNTPGICGLCEGIRYVRRMTTEAIFGKGLHLSRYAAEGLLSCRGVTVYGSYDIKVPVILFNKAGVEPGALAAYLAENGICTRSGLHCAPTAHQALGSAPAGGVRISFGCGNTKAEIDRFLRLVEKA